MGATPGHTGYLRNKFYLALYRKAIKYFRIKSNNFDFR